MFGLSAETINKINSVFDKYVQIEKVIVYGSRAKGNYRVNSDIDLTFFGPQLSETLLNNIDIELDDLLLPYKIDLSIYNTIENPDLKEHINRVGQIFYSKE